MTLALVTAPAVEPITLAEARLHLKLDATADDDLVTALITAVRERLDGSDGILGRALCTQTWDLLLDAFPGDAIKIPLPPLQFVESIKYVDTSGVLQTLSGSLYQVTGTSGFAPAKVWPAYGETWPSTRDQPEAVRVRFTAGYLDDSSPADTQAGVPQAIKAAIKLTLANLYEGRGDGTVEFPPQAATLLAPYRVSVFA